MAEPEPEAAELCFRPRTALPVEESKAPLGIIVKKASNEKWETKARTRTQKKLIAVVRQHGHLWAKDHKDFKHALKKKLTWEKIGKEFGTSGPAVEKDWTNLRNHYSKEVRLRDLERRSDVTAARKQFPHFEEMQFLASHVKRRNRSRHLSVYGTTLESETSDNYEEALSKVDRSEKGTLDFTENEEEPSLLSNLGTETRADYMCSNPVILLNNSSNEKTSNMFVSHSIQQQQLKQLQLQEQQQQQQIFRTSSSERRLGEDIIEKLESIKNNETRRFWRRKFVDLMNEMEDALNM